MKKLNRIVRSTVLTGGMFVGVYAASSALYYAFPYVREGAAIIYQRKIHFLEHNSIFPTDSRRRVAVFGNSKVLSGFMPDYFDSLSGGEVYSFNLGLPNATKFVPVLEDMVASGNVPTDIVITMPWSDPPETNPLVFIDDDKRIIETLVPFRYLPRDLAIFIYRSRYRGGITALYEETKIQSNKVLEDRGYHFVASQSIYPNSRLPENFALNSDRPNKYLVRTPSFDGEAFKRLTQILEDNRIQAFIAPTYVRIHEYKSDPPINLYLRRGVADFPHIHVVGSDYFSLPNRMFSDPLHLNPEGAEFYTTKLWELVGGYLHDEELSSS